MLSAPEKKAVIARRRTGSNVYCGLPEAIAHLKTDLGKKGQR
jgi:hypothetical protein